jgi:hypothetical protein
MPDPACDIPTSVAVDELSSTLWTGELPLNDQSYLIGITVVTPRTLFSATVFCVWVTCSVLLSASGLLCQSLWNLLPTRPCSTAVS